MSPHLLQTDRTASLVLGGTGTRGTSSRSHPSRLSGALASGCIGPGQRSPEGGHRCRCCSQACSPEPSSERWEKLALRTPEDYRKLMISTTLGGWILKEADLECADLVP